MTEPVTSPVVEPVAPVVEPVTAPVVEPVAPVEAPKMYDADYVKKLRAEAADYRTKFQAAKTDAETKLAPILKALGLDGETAPDPAKLAEQLTATQRENRELKVSHAVIEAARKHSADTDLLVPYLRGSSALDSLDPASATFAKDLSDLVKNLVEKNPKLKASAPAAPRSGGEFPGGSPTVQQITRDQLKGMTPEQINAARLSGALDQLLATGR
jgi:hypothetical protein